MALSPRTARLVGAFVVAFMTIMTVPAWAVLPPQYSIWQDFGEITSRAEIPQSLGVVDRIERKSGGGYTVYGGKCRLHVNVLRKPASGSDGRPMPGPSKIVRVDVGAKRCDP
jgi:hypothetical protein